MNYKDCVNYSRKMFKSNKRSFRVLVIGLVVPIAMTCFIFCLIIGIIGVSSSMKKNINVCSMYVSNLSVSDSNLDLENVGNDYTTERLEMGSFGLKLGLQGSSYAQSKPFVFSIDEKEYSIYTNTPQISFSNYSNQNHLVLQSEMDYMMDNNLGEVILAGKSFGNNTNEIMISSALLEELNIKDYRSIIGSKISIWDSLSNDLKKYYVKTNGLYEDRSSEYRGYQYLFLDKFTIVGVYNANVYKCPSRNVSEVYEALQNPLFWVKDDSLCYSSYHKEGIDFYYEDDFIEMVKCANEDGKIVINNSLIDRKSMKGAYLLQFKSGPDTYRYLSELQFIYPNFNSQSLYVNKSLAFYIDIYPICSSIQVILTWISAILFIIAIINVIRILDFSVYERKDFIAMLDSLGMDFNSKRRMFVFEILHAIVLTIVVSLIIGFVLSLCSSLGFTFLLNSDMYHTSWITYQIPWKLFFVVIPSIIILICSVAYAISNVVFLTMNKKITERRI